MWTSTQGKPLKKAARLALGRVQPGRSCFHHLGCLCVCMHYYDLLATKTTACVSVYNIFASCLHLLSGCNLMLSRRNLHAICILSQARSPWGFHGWSDRRNRKSNEYGHTPYIGWENRSIWSRALVLEVLLFHELRIGYVELQATGLTLWETGLALRPADIRCRSPYR